MTSAMFIQVAEYCPMCGAETHLGQSEPKHSRQKRRKAYTRGRSVRHEWRECSYCGWKSEKMKIVTTWMASDVGEDWWVYSRPDEHSFTR